MPGAVLSWGTFIFMIAGSGNRQVKNLILLRKKAKVRREEQAFLVEGRKLFEETPKELLKKVYVSEIFEKEEYKKLLSGTEYEVMKDSVFQSVCDTLTPQGILAVAAMPRWDKGELLQREKGLFLLLENIQDPGNLGTMMRTAEGAGMTAVIVDDTTVDLYNPKTIRSTMGSIYRVPFVRTEDFYGMIGQLKKGSVKIFAAHMRGSVSYEKPEYQEGSAFLIGNEGGGLTREAVSLADTCIHIPMEGKLESLNAAMAAGILMYEAKRQRDCRK